MTMPKLNNDICLIIAKYLIKPKYKLLDWITPTEKKNETKTFFL